jgi:hypothetical protein
MSNLRMTRGDTAKWIFTIKNNGAPFNLAAATFITWTARLTTGSVSIVLQKTLSGGGLALVGGGTSGQVRLTILPADSASIGVAGETKAWVWDLQVVVGADIYTVAKGDLIVDPDVTY